MLVPTRGGFAQDSIHTRAKTVVSILQSWFSIHDSLTFDNELDLFPRSLSMHQLLMLMVREGLTNGQVESIIAYCRVWQIFLVEDL